MIVVAEDRGQGMLVYVQESDGTPWRQATPRECANALADAQVAVGQFEASISDIGGCGDSSCLIKQPVGMATNGGCKCIERDTFKGRRLAMATRRLHKALRARWSYFPSNN